MDTRSLTLLGGLLLYVSPILLCCLYSKYEYGYSLSDNFKKWRTGKLLGIALFLLLSGMFLSLDFKSSTKAFWYLFWEPSFSVSLIVFSKPASELFEDFSSYFSYGEDFGFIIGWLGLLGAYIMFVVAIMRFS